jgi:P4 family phage/plasmid primase-like protien
MPIEHRDEGMHAKLTALIKTAVKFVPDEIILENDHFDTVAKQFEKASMVYHKYNSADGWSIYSEEKHQKVADSNEIESYIRKFLQKCKVTRVRRDKIKDAEGNVTIQEKTYQAEIDNKMQSAAYINNVMKWLRDMDNVKLKPSQNAPCALNGCLIDPENAIAFQNGILDVTDMLSPTLHVPTSDYYTFNYLPYNYNPDAVSMKWGEFLVEITDGDAEIMTLLQMWAGYLLMPGNKHQKFLLCQGEGANGKFVFFDTLAAAIGKDNVSNVPLACFCDTAKMFTTYGKMVNMSNESPKSLHGDAESIIKEYVGGDKMLWRQLYKDAFSAYPTAKLMFATNELPVIKDPSDGIWRRMLLVPFDVQIPCHKQNKNLAAELQTPEELAGIINWMLEGRADLEEAGEFTIPKKVQKELDIYRKNSNSVRLFAEEYLEIDTTDEERIIKQDLYQQYKTFCETNGNKPKNNSHFGQGINKLFAMTKDARVWDNAKKKTAYVGIKYQEGMNQWSGEYDYT